MKLMILDGNSIMNRAFYGVKLLSTRDGLYTNAIFGFLNIMEKMRHEDEPDAICVAFDLKGPTFRHLQYDGYKATRHPMPEELAVQMPLIKEVLQAMRIPVLSLEGWEADDLLGTVGKRCCAQGWECTVVTGDRDSLQLIDPCVHVKLIITKPGQTTATLYSEELFREEYGFDPIRLIDLKALMGDSSDNIPGVTGVGKKTAGDLLQQYGSLDAIYENLDSIRESVRKKLIADREMAYLSYELATIRCDAPIDFNPENCLIQPYDKPALLALFEKLQFIKLIDKYRLREAEPEQVEEAAANALSELPDASEVSALLLSADGSAFAVASVRGACSASCADHKEYLAAVLQNEELAVCDLKQICRWADQLLIDRPVNAFDISLAGYVLNPSASDYSVSALASHYLSHTVSDDAVSMVSVMPELAKELEQRMEAEGLRSVYYDIDLPLCAVLADMENEGILVDRDQLEHFGQMLSERIDRCQAAIYAAAEEEFNINSTKKLAEILFEKLQLPPVKKTKTGYSTNAEVLEKLKGQHPIIEDILEFRQLTKLKSTYADGLLKVIDPDGRIRTSFQNMVTATGRLSSTEPNLQNIPVRTELGSEIRKMFVPKEGCVLVDADYSQIELRVLAHIADDTAMQDAFRSGEDFHTVTASQVFGVPVSEVTPTMRRNAKAVNFGIVYGISKWSLSEDIGVSVWEAEEYISNYLRRFSGVSTYMKDIVSFARETGYVTTLYGRKRYLPELKSSNFNIRSMGERIALNTPVQGSAADIIKRAMIRVSDALRAAGLKARLVLQVHDELIVECPIEEQAQVMEIIRKEMEAAAALNVPLLAEAKCGESWYEAK
ncbi:MAG: DNA polymerase I [Oscillospiraceae bacterium]|nr:DNA polymerase I [Oscillospiraceae bacterium]